jgi:glycosyltransferase involved in cell wall biosynthesis
MDVADGLAFPPVDPPVGKAVLLCGADREALAHSRVLLDVLRELARDIVVMAPQAAGEDALGWLDAPDVGTVEIDCEAPGPNPLNKAAAVWKLARALEAEHPDVVHVIGLAPAALTCLALQLTPVPAAMVHLPDLGRLAPRSEPASDGMLWPYRKVAVTLLAALLRKPSTFLLAASGEDLAELRGLGIDPGPRCAVVAGPGVDPDACPVLPPAPGEMPVAAFVGQFEDASGVGVLRPAFERLWARGVRLQLEVHGARDLEGGMGALEEEWARWSLHPGVRCSWEWPPDAREVWRRAEICLWPVLTRQGLPRALLEAAACGRALLVSDARGGASAFVRHEAEGLVVPAGDVAALGAALERLARDTGLRHRLGAAARMRVLQGYTEAHIKTTLRGAYLSLAGALPTGRR